LCSYSASIVPALVLALHRAAPSMQEAHVSQMTLFVLHQAFPAAERARRTGWLAGHIASLMPARMSQVLTGQAVKKPAIMPICIKNQ
jgi:hypothetical protein